VSSEGYKELSSATGHPRGGVREYFLYSANRDIRLLTRTRNHESFQGCSPGGQQRGSPTIMVFIIWETCVGIPFPQSLIISFSSGHALGPILPVTMEPHKNTGVLRNSEVWNMEQLYERYIWRYPISSEEHIPVVKLTAPRRTRKIIG
jgi:hypothetical protein